MTPEEKYRNLERRALAVLRHPLDGNGFVRLARPVLRLLVWRYPAFEPYQSWSLIEDESVADLRVLRRVTWNRSADYGRASDPIKQARFMTEQDPSPTLEVIDVRISAGFLQGTIDSVEALEPPSGKGKPDVGLDGVINGLAIHDRGVELEWWCDGPPGWHHFTEGIEAIRARLEATIAYRRVD
jgi:hypothetical protein